MNEGIGGLVGLSGYELILVICVLIVLEELGIPMPFLPGDLLLVLAGVSITTAHVNPLVMVAATYISAVLGAIAGREIFERLGTAALRRIATLPRAGKRVALLMANLRRGGATAVFAGRITPGLRVVTTEISGLVAMPRRTFLRGLMPAVALYEAVFLGLGTWLGPTAWATIEPYKPPPGKLLLGTFVVIGCAVMGRQLAKHIRSARLKHRETIEVHT